MKKVTQATAEIEAENESIRQRNTEKLAKNLEQSKTQGQDSQSETVKSVPSTSKGIDPDWIVGPDNLRYEDYLKNLEAKDSVPSASSQSQTVQSGEIRGRYLKSPEGFIRDTTTGLDWIVGPEKISYDDAVSWVRRQTMAGGGWRMPRQAELKGLYEEGVGKVNRDPLLGSSGWWVWAEPKEPSEIERIMKNPPMAWIFDFDTGSDLNAWVFREPADLIEYLCVLVVRSSPDTNVKISEAKPVAKPEQEEPGVKPASGRATRKEKKSEDGRFQVSQEGVIKDTQTGLEWLVGPDKDMSYDEAETWLRSRIAASGGWHMPTEDQLIKLFSNQEDTGKRDVDPVFETTGSWFWLGERDASSAWVWGFEAGVIHTSRDNSTRRRVFAVRLSAQG